MSQYPLLFSVAKRPQVGVDERISNPNARHIVVLCRGQFYWFDAMSRGGDCVAVTLETLVENLRLITEDARKVPHAEAASVNVSVLSGLRRDEWAEYRASLEKLDSRNAESLRLIDTALFVLNLDDDQPSDMAGMMASLLHGSSLVSEQGEQTGGCLNRWFDQTLQLIVWKDGAAGIAFEETAIDGHTALRFASDVYTDTILRFAKTIRGDVQELLHARSPEEHDTAPRKIVWRLDKELRRAIKFAEIATTDIIHQHEVRVLEYTGFGKRWIVRRKMSPDGFVQMLLQLAYYRLYGTVPTVLETVQTKRFQGGRYDQAQTATAESAAMLRSWRDSNAEHKMELLHEAVDAHSKLIRDVTNGQGFVWHLRALEASAAQRGFDLSIFRHEAWQNTAQPTLKTSNCGNPSLRAFGFGPENPEGFAIGYLIKNDGVNICAVSRRRQTDRYIQLLSTALDETHALLEDSAAGSFQLASSPLSRDKPRVNL